MASIFSPSVALSLVTWRDSVRARAILSVSEYVKMNDPGFKCASKLAQIYTLFYTHKLTQPINKAKEQQFTMLKDCMRHHNWLVIDDFRQGRGDFSAKMIN